LRFHFEKDKEAYLSVSFCAKTSFQSQLSSSKNLNFEAKLLLNITCSEVQAARRHRILSERFHPCSSRSLAAWKQVGVAE